LSVALSVALSVGLCFLSGDNSALLDALSVALSNAFSQEMTPLHRLLCFISCTRESKPLYRLVCRFLSRNDGGLPAALSMAIIASFWKIPVAPLRNDVGKLP
jgi:hypothetical protein